MNRIPIIFLIVLAAHFLYYTKYREQYRKNYIVTTFIIIIMFIANLATNIIDSQIYVNVVLGLYIITIPAYLYFERPMHKKLKEARNQEIMDRSSEHKQNFHYKITKIKYK